MVQFHFDRFLTKQEDVASYASKWETIKRQFTNSSAFNGWYNPHLTEEEFQKLETTAKDIQKNCDVFVVIGIGGSYLGAKAIIDCFEKRFSDQLPEIIFAGTTMASESLREIIDYIETKEVIVNVISKSGETLETKIAFECIMKVMQKKYAEEELKTRIIITTDPREGSLRTLVREKGYLSFPIPTNIGGRFSVLTAVGLLPLAVSGIPIREVIAGAEMAKNHLEDSYHYAALRDIWYRSGKKVEAFVVYDPKLLSFTEWLKQLFAETQGKEGKGILPTSLLYTRDLHSLGQFLQEGSPIVWETNITIGKQPTVKLENCPYHLGEIEKMAQESVCESHLENDTPSILIELDEKNAWNIGYLVFFFFMSAMIGAYLLDVRYFDQPGVKRYKEKLQEKLQKKSI